MGREGGGTVVWSGTVLVCASAEGEFCGLESGTIMWGGRAGLLQEGLVFLEVAWGGRVAFLFWHGWNFMEDVFGLFWWFLCLGMCLGDGSLAKRVA